MSGGWHGSGMAPAAGDGQHQHRDLGVQQGGRGCFSMGYVWQHPVLFPPHYGGPMCRPGPCPTAPTWLLQQHGVCGAVGAQGGLLHCRHPLLKWRRGEAVVFVGVWVRLEQGVLVRSIPCREITGGKGPGSPTHGVTPHPAPHERGRSHLQSPTMGSGGQGHGGRCRTASAPTAGPPGHPASGAVQGQCCLTGGTAGGRSHNPKNSCS